MKRQYFFILFVCVFGFFLTTSALASSTNGTIDPNNTGDHYAKFYDLSGDPSDSINFGKFTTQAASNISITSAGFRGYAWSELGGWIVTNCLDTTSGCSSSNGNFKISVADNGTLSGYAWGQSTGWINFGPFSNSSTPQVKIGPTGIFKGTTGNAGYAWSQSYGWILFDCTQLGACVTTDYIPPDSSTTQCSDSTDNDGDGLIDYPSDPGCSSGSDNDESNTTTGGGGGTSNYICSDHVDNDGDGLIDYPADPGCLSAFDSDESNIVINPSDTICSDGIDNDHDGKIDYPSDPGCMSALDTSEENVVPPAICADDLDNDKDGLVDYPADPGCSDAADQTEFNAVIIAVCSDNVDNDNDGLVDFPNDPGCTSPEDSDETDAVVGLYACSDTLDNDADGLIDYPNDPGCVNQFDQSEIDGIVPVINPPDDPGGGTNGVFVIGDDTIIGKITTVFGNYSKKTALLAAIVGLATTVGLGLLRILLNVPQLFSNFLPYVERGWATLLSFLGFRRFSEWGIVYDAKTKQPIDPAYVRLVDAFGKETATAITDINGRYGFLAAPGTYTMTAQKTNYTFPSTFLTGKDRDEVYADLYFGEKITITKQDEVIVKNIPMDALAFDWNEFAKRQKKILSFFIRHEVFFSRIINLFFYFGFISALIAFVFSPIFYNAMVLVAYVVFEILNRSALLKPRAGSILRKGKLYPFVLVEIYNATLGQKIAQKVTNQYGRFFSLVPKGKYYLKISERGVGPDAGFVPVYTSTVFDVKDGYIHRTISI